VDKKILTSEMEDYIHLEFMKNIELKQRQVRMNQSAVGGLTKQELRQIKAERIQQYNESQIKLDSMTPIKIESKKQVEPEPSKA